jgi:hypothetical protein
MLASPALRMQAPIQTLALTDTGNMALAKAEDTKLALDTVVPNQVALSGLLDLRGPETLVNQ